MNTLTDDVVIQRDYASLRQAFSSARPFPHCVIDDFANPESLDGVLAEWPTFESMYFKDCATSIKAQAVKGLGPVTREVIERLNSDEFVKKLEALTGIDGLKSDPDLLGGGLHEIPPGGFLDMHIDFNWHPKKGARKVNLLLYLNRGWQWNGHLVLGEAEKTVAPIFNRCVIFNTTETSWHGHPTPLNAPMSRKSIALYYYRDEPKPKFVHNTIYR